MAVRYILSTLDGKLGEFEITAKPNSFVFSQQQMITVFHGSLQKEFVPEYGRGKPYHDYGKGFYTTVDRDLANEWAAALSKGENGYCHTFSLDLTGLSCLRVDSEEDVLTWMAILMKHRPGTDSRRWDSIQKRYIEKYYIDVDAYDAIFGYRANDSYLAMAKQFARGEVSVRILSRLLKLGSLGTQVCLKSRDAFSRLRHLDTAEADYALFYTMYKKRDEEARRLMKALVDSQENELDQTIETII